jgi:hypothetical protein
LSKNVVGGDCGKHHASMLLYFRLGYNASAPAYTPQGIAAYQPNPCGAQYSSLRQARLLPMTLHWLPVVHRCQKPAASCSAVQETLSPTQGRVTLQQWSSGTVMCNNDDDLRLDATDHHDDVGNHWHDRRSAGLGNDLEDLSLFDLNMSIIGS